MNPRLTERVPGFPACHLLALVDADADLEGAYGLSNPTSSPPPSACSPSERGAHALDVSGATRGLRGRPMRVLQDILYGRSTLQLHETHLRRGGHLLLIPAREWAQCQQLVTFSLTGAPTGWSGSPGSVSLT
jgi:hypothetical protein